MQRHPGRWCARSASMKKACRCGVQGCAACVHYSLDLAPGRCSELQHDNRQLGQLSCCNKERVTVLYPGTRSMLKVAA